MFAAFPCQITSVTGTGLLSIQVEAIQINLIRYVTTNNSVGRDCNLPIVDSDSGKTACSNGFLAESKAFGATFLLLSGGRFSRYRTTLLNQNIIN